MSSRRRLRKRCQEKKSYETEEEAGRAAARYRRIFGTKTVPYRCRFCHKIHLGHRLGSRNAWRRAARREA